MTGLDRPLPLRPMGLGDLLGGAVKLFAANWRTVLPAVAVVIVPLQLVLAWLLQGSASAGFLRLITALDPTELQRLRGEELNTLLITVVIYTLVLSVVVGAVCAIAGGSYVGRPLTWGAALRVAGRHAGSLASATILIYLAQLLVFLPAVLIGVGGFATRNEALFPLTLLLVLLGIVGTIVIGALYTATPPAIVTESLGPVQGMTRSWRLRRPRLWPTVGAVLVAEILAIVVGFVIGGLVTTAGASSFALLTVREILVQLIQLPFLAIVSTLLYFDGRIRREGFDLQVPAGEPGA